MRARTLKPRPFIVGFGGRFIACNRIEQRHLQYQTNLTMSIHTLTIADNSLNHEACGRVSNILSDTHITTLTLTRNSLTGVVIYLLGLARPLGEGAGFGRVRGFVLMLSSLTSTPLLSHHYHLPPSPPPT